MNWIKDLKNFDRQYFLLHREMELHVQAGSPKVRELRMELIREEYKELCDAIGKREFAKELADLIYVLVGTATWLDINLEEVFKRVHHSNMGKFGDDAEVRADGKLLKSKSYEPPDLFFIKEKW